MANRDFKPIKGGLEHGLVFMSGVIDIAAGGAVSSDSILGASAAKLAGAGDYQITLEDSYYELKSAQFTVESSTDQNLVPQIKASDVSSAKTINVSMLAAGVAADFVGAGKIHVLLVLKNSSVL